jgi:hypothetical protein
MPHKMMAPERTAEVRTVLGETFFVPLISEGGREAACLVIGGVCYHLERIAKAELTANYRIDTDPDYIPQADAEGFCYILAPYSA